MLTATKFNHSIKDAANVRPAVNQAGRTAFPLLATGVILFVSAFSFWKKMTLQPKSTTTDDSESEKIDGYLHMIKYTTHYLELQMIVYLAIWFIIGYLQKHICLNLKVHHKQN